MKTMINIVDVPVQTFERNVICNACGKGNMVYGNLCFTSMPPKFEHKCSECKDTKLFTQKYPMLVTMRVTDGNINPTLVDQESL